MAEMEQLPPTIAAAIEEREKQDRCWTKAALAMQHYADLFGLPANEIVRYRPVIISGQEYHLRLNVPLAYPDGKLKTLTVNLYKLKEVDDRKIPVHVQEAVIGAEWIGGAIADIDFETSPVAGFILEVLGSELAEATTTLIGDMSQEVRQARAVAPFSQGYDAPNGYAQGIQ